MKKFLIKIVQFSLIGAIPLALLITGYIALDPFKVIRSYDSYFDLDKSGWVGLNKDFVSTSTLINNSQAIDYNSFIFGNSRSIFYQVSDWKQYLPENSTCFHYDASSETLWALEKKIEFIDKRGMKMDNILLVLDYATLVQDKPNSGHLFVISPALVNNSNIIDFHKTFLLAFLSPKFLYAYLDYNISGLVKPYMKESKLLDDRPRNYDVETNEVRYEYFENLIRENKYYDSERLSVFYERDSIQKHSPISIKGNQKDILININEIFKKHKAKVKIVISPLYNQEKLNDHDLSFLKKIFGEDTVFDFSGINEFTNNYKNYYESSHYRPHVAKAIMSRLYERID